jgi:hypothetical protein
MLPKLHSKIAPEKTDAGQLPFLKIIPFLLAEHF